MRKRGLTLIGASAALLAVSPAGGRVLDKFSFPDATGDGSPDITRVTVGSNSAGGITFIVQLGDRRELSDNEYVFVLVNSDGSTATGQPPNGVDHAIQLDMKGAAVFVGVGPLGRTRSPSRCSAMCTTASASRSTRATWRCPPTSSSSGSRRRFPLTLRITAFEALAKTVKVGKSFGVGMQAHRSDLDELTSDGFVTCSAKVGKRKVKVSAGFPEDIAACVGTAPKFAKGKR